MQATTLTNLMLLVMCSMILFGTWSRKLAKTIGVIGLLILVSIVVYMSMPFGSLP